MNIHICIFLVFKFYLIFSLYVFLFVVSSVNNLSAKRLLCAICVNLLCKFCFFISFLLLSLHTYMLIIYFCVTKIFDLHASVCFSFVCSFWLLFQCHLPSISDPQSWQRFLRGRIGLHRNATSTLCYRHRPTETKTKHKIQFS